MSEAQQLPLFSDRVVIKTGCICRECDERRARRVVAFLRARGWDAEYGGEGYGSTLPPGDEFRRDFYAACDKA